jgi:hypothetical protein
MQDIGYRKCFVDQVLRQQISCNHPKVYVPTIKMGGMRVPLNRQCKTASEAQAYARRFADKWNAAEDIRLARDDSKDGE